MKIKLYLYLLLVGFFIFLRCSIMSEISQQQVIKGPTFTPYTGLKTTIAVLDFKNHTNEGGEQYGSAVADMLVSLLVKSGRFIVLERQQVQQILEEQALGQSGVISEETAAQVGKLLGVRSLLLGDILEVMQQTGSHTFKDNGEDKKKKKDPWELALKATVGHVKFHYRLVNTTTGETIIADDVSATEIRPAFGIKTKKFDFEDMFELDQTVIGIATRKAVNRMAKFIVQNAYKIKWVGKVVQVKEDGTLYFTPGRSSGVRIGSKFEIWKKDELAEAPCGIVEVLGLIGEKVAKAMIIQGNEIETGDVVREISDETSAE